MTARFSPHPLPTLFVVLCLCAPLSTLAADLYVSAEPFVASSSGANSLSATQFLGSRFTVTGTIEVTAIGGNIRGTFANQNLFGAIVVLQPGAILPQGLDTNNDATLEGPFDAGEVVASAAFQAPFDGASGESADVRVPLSIVLEPGDYAIVFGAGILGSPPGDGGNMPSPGGQVKTSVPLVPSVPSFGVDSYFFWNGNGLTWINGASSFKALRFVVEGNANAPPSCNIADPGMIECVGGSTMVMLDGTGSTDPDLGPLTYSWTSDCPGAFFDDPEAPMPILTVDTSSICPGGLSCAVNLTVTDDFEASDSCTLDLPFVDTTAPTLTVPADAALECDESSMPANTGQATATDNCASSPVVTFTDDTSGLTGCNGTGTIVRTWTATDGCSNAVSADQLITVADTVVPSITSFPPDVELECAADVPPADIGLVSATDNCGVATITSVGDVDNGGTGCASDPLVITRTYRAADDCGNFTEQTQTLTVMDVTAPDLTLDTTPITAVDVDCSGDESVVLPTATADDNCDSGVMLTNDAPSTFPAGETTAVTFSAEDACGNVTSESVDVTVKYGATIEVLVHELHFGWGCRPSITKVPMVGATVYAFERSGGEYCSHHCSWWHGWHWWRHVVHECDESPAVNSAVTDENGVAMIDVPPGDYIVITFLDFDDDGEADHYLGRRARGVDCGEVLKRRLRLLVTPRGKRLAARIRRFIGSELLIVEPDLMIWDDVEQEYPFGFESEGDWGVTVEVEPPDGFVSDEDALSSDVDNEVEALQFTVTEVGSDLVPTHTTFEIVHNGIRQVVQSEVGIKLTPDYARSRGFEVSDLRARGLIHEPGESQAVRAKVKQR